MTQANADDNGFTAQLKKSTRNLNKWALMWVLSTAIATFGPQFVWTNNDILTTIGILTNMLVGVGMLYAHKNHLQYMDEMQRKILLDAMASALGVGLVVGLSYSLVDITNLLPIKADISHLIILIGLTYIVATVVGNRRYK